VGVEDERAMEYAGACGMSENGEGGAVTYITRTTIIIVLAMTAWRKLSVAQREAAEGGAAAQQKRKRRLCRR